jgi:hypothetical protein
LLHDAGVGTNPGTDDGPGRAERVSAPVPQDTPPAFADNQAVAILGRKGRFGEIQDRSAEDRRGLRCVSAGTPRVLVPGCYRVGSSH